MFMVQCLRWGEWRVSMKTDSRLAWFCLRTQPRHEHIAAAHLSKVSGLDAFLPRIRFRRSTRDGPVWFTEALFPSYLFARFNLGAHLRQVHHCQGVRGIVHFGDQWPAVPDTVIDELRAIIPAGQVHVVPDEFRPGDEVVISGGVFHNLRGLVTRILPARQRVAVLLEFLGRQTPVELPGDTLVAQVNGRARVI
jgi:transcriptional antiterminator RfaH